MTGKVWGSLTASPAFTRRQALPASRLRSRAVRSEIGCQVALDCAAGVRKSTRSFPFLRWGYSLVGMRKTDSSRNHTNFLIPLRDALFDQPVTGEEHRM